MTHFPNPDGFKDDQKYQRTIENLSQHNERELLWRGVDILEDPRKCSKRLKFLIRRGVPDSKRRAVWTAVTGITLATRRGEDPSIVYQQRLRLVFGLRIPKRILKPPTFGGTLHFENYFLTEAAHEYCKRILCVIAMEFPEINYCPILPDFVCLLLHFLNEAEAYSVVQRIISEESKTTVSKRLEIDRKGWTRFLMTFNDLVAKELPALVNYMQSRGIDSCQFAERWFYRLFVPHLPFQTVLRVFDAYLNEGKKILYRIALILLKIHSAALLKCESSEAFVQQLTTDVTVNLPDTDTLMKLSCAFNISKKHMKKFDSSNKVKASRVIEPNAVYYHPKITTPSKIIKDEMFEYLYEWIPHRYRICDPVLLYRSESHGYSFKTFLNKTEDQEPLLLLIKSDNENIFGAYLSTKWQHVQQYYGTRECFLFTLFPRAQHFPWTEGNTEQFINLDKTSLKIGGGFKIGLYLNDTWNGSSERCETFRNEPLNGATSTLFECVGIEVYSFQ